jgi:mannose-6-phosphate isomerase
MSSPSPSVRKSGTSNLEHLVFLGPNRVWRTYLGGRMLDELEGKPQPGDSHFPEDWISSTTRAVNIGREDKIEGISTFTLAGQNWSLPEYLSQSPENLLGPAHVKKYGTNIQFLAKFLDSAIRLHIQCHPTIPFSQKYLNANSGKTEAYYVLGHRPEVKSPYIYLGFQNSPTPQEWKTMVEAQDIPRIESCFEKIPVKAGDVLLVPGGRAHAIGEGVFMVEIMEPTDFVVRMEFERGGYTLPEKARFMDRGIDFAISMFDYTPLSIQQVREKFFHQPKPFKSQSRGVEESIIGPEQTSCFAIRRLRIQNGDYLDEENNSFHVGICVGGEGEIVEDSGQRHAIKMGSKFFKPFCRKSIRFETRGTLEILKVLPPVS